MTMKEGWGAGSTPSTVTWASSGLHDPERGLQMDQSWARHG